jgi:hypothetical protein
MELLVVPKSIPSMMRVQFQCFTSCCGGDGRAHSMGAAM